MSEFLSIGDEMKKLDKERPYEAPKTFGRILRTSN